MPVFRLPRTPIFPHPFLAEPDGWLAVEGDLSPERLITAYTFGIFPWYNPGEPIRWHAPIPRFGFHPSKLKIQKSLRSTLRKAPYEVTFNRDFRTVIHACKTIERPDQWGTWITDDMEAAYIRLHELGYAHSAEIWEDNEMVGGLYGIQVGNIFCGESMFTYVSDASKVGFVHLVRKLEKEGVVFIDCQQETDHLKRFGARMYSRETYWAIVRENLAAVLKS